MPDLPPFSHIDAMSENELLLCIGQETVESDAAVPQSLGSLIERGRQVMQKAEPMLKTLLCDPEGPKPVLKALSDEALHAAVVALIAGTAGFAFTPIAITYITAVILRRGLGRYCTMPNSLLTKSDPADSVSSGV